MDSCDLTKSQVEQMHDRLAPTLGCLSRMLGRINETHFPPDDPLRRKAFEAQAAMQGLVMELHYLRCDYVGKKWEPGLGSGDGGGTGRVK